LLEFLKTFEVNFDKLDEFVQSHNYPNPCYPSTTIRFSLPEPGNVKVAVYNIIGEQIVELVNGFKEAGVHTLSFDASQITAEFTSTK
jgi:hypothetical protein